MMQRSRRRGWPWSRALSRFWHLGSPFSAFTLRTRCGRLGLRPLTWGPVRASGRGGLVCKAGWQLSRRGRIITMADRYQDRPLPADDDYHRGDDDLHASAQGESDPLAELARLIGQTDPFATMGRAY